MKKIVCIILLCMTSLTLASCAEADAIKNGIKDKLPKPEEQEYIEAIMEKPVITEEYKNKYSLLVVQEVKEGAIIATLDGTEVAYSIPNWFGNAEIEPGTYLFVEHADNSLPTNPMQFGFIYSMKYFSQNGSSVDGIKPN